MTIPWWVCLVFWVVGQSVLVKIVCILDRLLQVGIFGRVHHVGIVCVVPSCRWVCFGSAHGGECQHEFVRIIGDFVSFVALIMVES